MTEIVAALIGGAIVLITTGPVIGAVRRRRAARELLEIRELLAPNDDARRAQIDSLLDEELKALERLGNTPARMVIISGYIGIALLSVGLVARGVVNLVPSETGRDVLQYVSGSSLLLAIIPLYVTGRGVIEMIGARRSRILVTLAIALSLLGLVIFANWAILGTPYHENIT